MSVCLSDVVCGSVRIHVTVLHAVVLVESVILMRHFHVMQVVVVRVAREILHATIHVYCVQRLLPVEV